MGTDPSIAVGILSLLNFPIGTAIGAYTLFVLCQEVATATSRDQKRSEVLEPSTCVIYRVMAIETSGLRGSAELLDTPARL
jgi:hypothetical protein